MAWSDAARAAAAEMRRRRKAGQPWRGRPTLSELNRKRFSTAKAASSFAKKSGRKVELQYSRMEHTGEKYRLAVVKKVAKITNANQHLAKLLGFSK